MACRVEPGFPITTAVDAVELEGRGTHHGINFFTDDERTRNIVAHLDTQARVRGERKVPEFSHLNGSGLARNQKGIAVLVAGSGISAGIDLP